jgi:tRNA (cytidine32/uridine32-2'-O)-methyltransferase
LIALLTNIRIVLIQTTHPGNIGAVARAMKNMCLTHLCLVAPKTFPSVDADARAVGAEDVLAQAIVCDTLDEAVKECRLVIGTSGRARRIDWPSITPKQGAEKLVAGAQSKNVALVFGREQSGLTNAELDRCQYMVRIPANPDFTSMNVAAAVQVLTYEILLASQLLSIEPQETLPLPRQEEMRLFYQHLHEVLVQIDFLDPDNPRLLMRRLIRLFNRANPDQKELNILRGILTAVQRQLKA